MRVLVTGAGGFIGSHLAADLLRRGHDVVALDLHLDRVAHLEPRERFVLLEEDVGDPAAQKRALDGVDTVFHLAAAHLGVRQSKREYRRVNVGAVRTLVAAAREAGVRRFVHCSSVGVYGRVEHPPADEETACNPDLEYERTKLAGEQVVLEAARQEGLPAVVLRPVWVYGPGCPRTERLFRAIAKGRFVVGGRGRGFRHCVFIDDMLEAFRLAAGTQAALGQVIVVGDGAAVRMRDLVDEIAALTRAPSPRSVPLPFLAAAAVLAEILCKALGKEPPLSRRTLKLFTANTSFRIDRARRLLGFEPRYDLRAGLAETHRRLTERPGSRAVASGPSLPGAG
jgi:nucleoside-diphosphate-sugar epimerase